MFRKFILTVLGFIIFSLEGCGTLLPSHFHNSGREAIAIETQQLMNNYAEKSPEMYSAMLSNLQNFKAEEDFLLEQLSNNYAVAFSTKAPTKNWEKFKTDITKIKEEGVEFDKLIVKKSNGILKSKVNARNNFKSAGEAIKKAKEKEHELRIIVNHWNQLNALLRNAYASLPDVLTAMEESGSSNDSLKKISGNPSNKITYVDSEGKEVTANIGDIIKNTQILFNEKVNLRSFPPGIDLTVLNLGLELAEVQKKKAQAELNSLIARTRLFEDALIARKLTKTLLQSAENKMKHFRINPLQSILTETRRPSKLDPGEIEITLNNISNILLTIRIISTSQILISQANVSLGLGLARLDHRDSIIFSSSADEAWQAVIRNGTSGLVAYHKAGWSDEDTANVLRTAQMIALAVISGGVL